MIDSLDRSFGLVIAFLLPGFLILLGTASLLPTVAGWLSQNPEPTPSVGGFLYVVLASLALGLIASAVRWLLIDSLLHQTGLVRPRLDFSRLQKNLQAYELAVQHNYRHYQFYANSFIAGWVLAGCQLAAGTLWTPPAWLGFTILEGVLLITSRDCLNRHYERIGDIIGADD